MTSKKRILSVALAGLVVLSSFAAVGIGSSATGNVTANDSLAVGVQNAGNDGATVTVTHDGSAVANASVTVAVADDNVTYAGSGTHVTDASGAVSLPEPAQNVTVEVTAAKGNMTGSATATLTTAAETEDEEKTFGDLVSSFVHEMLNAGEDDGPIGQVISEFVTANNPGNASEKRPDHAGKPDDAGKSDKKNATAGNSTDAGSGNSTDDGGSQGPPGNSGDGNDDSDDEETTEKGNNGKGKNKGKGKGR